MAAAESESELLASVYDKMLFGVVTTLRQRRDVVEVKVQEAGAATELELQHWEQRNGVELPTDIKHFLRVCDGLHLVWTAATVQGSVATVGRLYLHPLREMRTIDCTQMEGDADSGSAGEWAAPSGSEESKTLAGREWFAGPVVELDDGNGCGRTALVYDTDDRTPSVWFSDRASMWHRLATSFSEYLTAMIMHLGIPGWQYGYTPHGLSPATEQWLHRFAPLRLEMCHVRRNIFLDPTFMEPLRLLDKRIDLELAKVIKLLNDEEISDTSVQQPPNRAKARRPGASVATKGRSAPGGKM